MKSTFWLNCVALKSLVPSVSELAVSEASPALPSGSRRAPASNAIVIVTIGN